MSFSDFLQWIRNFFSSRPTPSSGSTGSASASPVATEKPNTSTSEATTPSTNGSSSTDNTAATSPTSGPSATSQATSTTVPNVDTPTETTPTQPNTTPSDAPGAVTPPPLTEQPVSTPAEPETTTPPPLPETQAPVAPTAPSSPPEPQNLPPVITAITTASSKVALNQEITFQIITHPVNRYDNCTVDLSGAKNASIVSNIDPTTGRFSLRFNKASSSDNDTQLIKVSNSQGKADIAVTVSLMKLFWHHHPGRKNVCDETLFVNQCAIRMGTALELSGIKMSQDRRVLRRCTTEYRAFKHHKEGLVHGHVLAAQELANWIKSQTSTFGRRSVVQTKEEIMGRSGVIFFRDGWGTTDHIDVWDGEALVGGFPSYFDSDFKELWFWDVY